MNMACNSTCILSRGENRQRIMLSFGSSCMIKTKILYNIWYFEKISHKLSDYCDCLNNVSAFLKQMSAVRETL